MERVGILRLNETRKSYAARDMLVLDKTSQEAYPADLIPR